jgi:hypothetical protein
MFRCCIIGFWIIDPERSTSMFRWVKNVSRRVRKSKSWVLRTDLDVCRPKKASIFCRQNMSIEPSAKWTRECTRVRELRTSTYEFIVGRYILTSKL